MDLARVLLSPLTMGYGAVIRARNRYYSRPGTSHHPGIPVISVGNITTGGTGKTPLVIDIARRLRALGRKPAILTRGYAARRGELADEVREFHDALPDTPVVVNADRVAGAAAARDQHGADCIVLDDGFQHRRLARDLDLVVIDALDPWGNGWMLPAGRLREPLSSLRRASAFVISRINQAEREQAESIAGRLRRIAGDKPVLSSAVSADLLVRYDGRTLSAGELASVRVLPVCGIGNPRTFLRLLEGLASEVLEAITFSDHHRYTKREAREIVRRARAARADLVVTTRKDWFKLERAWPAAAALALARLDMRVVLLDEHDLLRPLLRSALDRTV